MSDKYKVVAIIGKSASGKDTLQKELVEKSEMFHSIISTTTRPPREGEVEGVNYFFTSNEEFAEKVLNYEMLEAVPFKDWFYGTELKALSKDKINVGVFNPAGVYALLTNEMIEVIPIEVVCNDRDRLIRSLMRESNPDIEEIFRRYRADNRDFSDLEFDKVVVFNEDDIKTVVDKCLQYLDHLVKTE